MSIHEFYNKIKGYVPVDILTISYLCIVIFVGMISFYLGRTSVNISDANTQSKSQVYPNGNTNQSDNSTVVNADSSGGYFGSINGKLYYSYGCKAGNRIAKKNIINFSSISEAEKAGYMPSNSCK